MNVKDLFRSLEKDAVLGALYGQYPDQVKNAQGYNEAWDEILTIEAIENDFYIIIFYVDNDEPFETPEDFVPWFSVSGKKDGDETTWAIEYDDWGEWLARNIILDDNVPALTEAEILAHILYEMTWSGYANKDVRDHADEMFAHCKEAMEKIEAGDLEDFEEIDFEKDFDLGE